MSSTHPPAADAAAVMDLAARLDRDRALPQEELRRRDRAIGRELQGRRLSPRRQVLAWLSLASDGDAPLPGERVRKALRLGNALLVVLGAVLGWLASAAVYYYDGSRPVNVVHVLAVFVGGQLLLLLLLALTLLPRGALGRIPGMRAILETLDLLRPGRLQRLASPWLPEGYRRKADALLGASRAHRALFGSLEKWFITASSQLFAVSFNIGALAGCIYLILFSDLAFAWSTTLRISPAEVHSLTDFLAAPWRSVLPSAVPSLALIEASQFYRLGGAGAVSADPAVLGGWWPFLVASMTVYGLLPRLAILAIARWRLRSCLDHAVLHLPGVVDLLDRMNGELVETQARDPESVSSPATAGRALEPDLPAGSPCVLVNWGEVPLDSETSLRHASGVFRCSPAGLLAAGAPRSPDEDRETVRKASELAGEGGVIVLVRAWEPPLEEFVDFLAGLRSALSPGAPLVVAPVGVDGRSVPSSPTSSQLEIWRSRLAALGDPWISVRPFAGPPP